MGDAEVAVAVVGVVKFPVVGGVDEVGASGAGQLASLAQESLPADAELLVLGSVPSGGGLFQPGVLGGVMLHAPWCAPRPGHA